MKFKKRISFAICLIATLCAGMVTAHAYAILTKGGFRPIPTQVVSYNGFSSSINSAISSACSALLASGENNHSRSIENNQFQSNKNNQSKIRKRSQPSLGM